MAFWHWSSFGQLNLEPTRPNGLVGCKAPTDLVKISVKEATHMGFYYTIILGQWYDCPSAWQITQTIMMKCIGINNKEQQKA